MSNARRLILPPGVPTGGGHAVRVRNGNGDPVPCCWGDCWKPADNNHRVEVPHPTPRWHGEKLVYTFCGERHKVLYLANSPWQDRG